MWRPNLCLLDFWHRLTVLQNLLLFLLLLSLSKTHLTAQQWIYGVEPVVDLKIFVLLLKTLLETYVVFRQSLHKEAAMIGANRESVWHFKHCLLIFRILEACVSQVDNAANDLKICLDKTGLNFVGYQVFVVAVCPKMQLNF